MSKYIFSLPLLTLFTFAQNRLPDYQLVNKIAFCKTVKCVAARQKDVHHPLELRVLYTKWMLLNPSSRTASEGLLRNLPATEDEVVAFMQLPDWHEGSATSKNVMKQLAIIYENWPRLTAVAVRRFPQYLPTYIQYGRLAMNDIHSDYTGYARTVCRANRGKFVAAFRTLSVADREYIRSHVFDPENCRPIFVSEAEQ